MRFMVAVDLEGVACAVAPAQGSIEDAFNIVSVRRQATREANAAVKALFDAGASEVVVWDNHGRGCSLEHEALDERCLIALGATSGARFPELASDFAGILLIGYHAMEGTPDATLAHSYSSAAYRAIRVNGEAYGEIGIDAMIAGQMKVPVLLVSSDDKGCAEARALMPWVRTVETKRSLSYNRIISRQPMAAASAIYDAVGEALKGLAQARPITLDGPVELSITYRTQAMARAARLSDREGRPFAQTDAYTRTGMIRDIASIVHYI